MKITLDDLDDAINELFDGPESFRAWLKENGYGEPPTDKEIEHAAPACPEMNMMDTQARNWFIAGAKWCRMTMSIPVTDNP